MFWESKSGLSESWLFLDKTLIGLFLSQLWLGFFADELVEDHPNSPDINFLEILLSFDLFGAVVLTRVETVGPGLLDCVFEVGYDGVKLVVEVDIFGAQIHVDDMVTVEVLDCLHEFKHEFYNEG